MSRITSRWEWVALAAIAGAFVWVAAWGGPGTAPLALGGSIVALLPERARVRVALRSAAVRYGLNPDWLDVLGWHESRWRLAAVNNAGGDGARGGAWGPTQITEKTARGFGYEGPMSDLTFDPDLAADLTARMIAERAPASLADLAAFWNAGRRADDPALPASTRVYIAQIEGEAANLPAPPEGVS